MSFFKKLCKYSNCHNFLLRKNNNDDQNNSNDHLARAQDDMYSHVNKEWVDLPNMCEKQIKSIIDDACSIPKCKLDSTSRNIRALYKSCINVDKISNLNGHYLNSELEHIQSIKRLEDLFIYAIKLQINSPFTIDIKQRFKHDQTIPHFCKGITPIFDTNAKPHTYVRYMRDMYALVDWNPSPVGSILELESKISSFVLLDNEATKMYTTAQLEVEFPEICWSYFLSNLSIGELPMYAICNPSYTRQLFLLFSNDFKTWKNYFSWLLLHSYASSGSLTPALLERSIKYSCPFGDYLQKSIGKKYILKYYPVRVQKNAEKIVAHIVSSLEFSIQTNNWMDIYMRRTALQHLSKLEIKVGYPIPHRSYDYEDNIHMNATELFKNTTRTKWASYKYFVQRVKSKCLDLDEWFINPQDLTISYNAEWNELILPASLFQSPFFILDDDVFNYASIGSIIATKLVDIFQIYKKDKIFDTLFSQYKNQSMSKYKKEAVSHAGGIHIAYLAYYRYVLSTSKIEDQRFFKTFAETMRKKYTNPQNGLQRDLCNISLSNLQAWIDAFDVKKDDVLYVIK
jgi:predicted metalloendopeptidase